MTEQNFEIGVTAKKEGTQDIRQQIQQNKDNSFCVCPKCGLTQKQYQGIACSVIVCAKCSIPLQELV